jgi:hypothetical protein
MLNQFAMAGYDIRHSVVTENDEEARREGRILSVANLNFHATRRDFEETLHELGFDNLTLYWPDAAPPETMVTVPWCRVLFEDAATANRARAELDGADFRGRSMWVGTAYRVRASNAAHIPLPAPSSSGIASPMPVVSSSAAPGPSVKFNPAATKYPDSWRFNPRRPDAYREAFMSDYAALDAWYHRKNVKNRFLLGTDATGEAMFYARQYHGEEAVRDPYIMMVKKSANGSVNELRQFKEVPLSKAREDEAWEPWIHPEKPTSLEMPRLDNRHVSRVWDVLSCEAPWRDTKHIFRRGIEIANAKSSKPWMEGLISDYHGEEPSLSFADEFRPPALSNTFDTATSFGHPFQYKRPPNAGMGWGDFDGFPLWQACGRKITLNMIPRKPGAWNPYRSEHVIFANAKTGKKTEMEPCKTADGHIVGSAYHGLPVSLKGKMEGGSTGYHSYGATWGRHGRREVATSNHRSESLW